MGGGAAVDIGVHMLDLARHVVEHVRVVSVSGAAFSKIGPNRRGLGSWGERNMSGSFDVDDLATALIRLEDSTVINLEVSWAAFTDAEENSPYLHIMGDQGGVSIRNTNGKWMAERFDSSVDIPFGLPEPPIDERACIARHFIDCIAQDATPLVTGRSGYINTAILEALYQSSESGQEVGNFLDE